MIPTNVITKLWIIFSHCFYSSEAKQSCDSCIEHFSNETKLWFNLCFLPTETFARTWEMLLVKAQCLKQLQCLVRWRMCLWWNRWARLKLQICRSGSRHSGPQNLKRWIVACGVSAIHATFFAAAAAEAIKDIIVDPDVRCAEQYFGWNQKIQAAHVEDDLAFLGRPQIARFANIFVARKKERQIGLSRHICRGLSGAWPPRAEQIVCDWVDKEGAKGLLGCLWRENFFDLWPSLTLQSRDHWSCGWFSILTQDNFQRRPLPFTRTPWVQMNWNAGCQRGWLWLTPAGINRCTSSTKLRSQQINQMPVASDYQSKKGWERFISIEERNEDPFLGNGRAGVFFFNTFWYLFRSCCWLWRLP